MLIEVIASSAEDCAAIQRAGAHRIELCAALVLGGLTPSVGTVAESKARCDLPVMAMVRPRESGMAYSPTEFATMERDLDAVLEAGADGAAFGVLHDDGTIDKPRMKLLIEKCQGRQAVCHRAFDVTPDPFEALETLVGLGIQRVLTSGGRATALDGADRIRALIERADGRIEILPGAGIHAGDVAEIVRRTGCSQVHIAAFGRAEDTSGHGNPSVAFSGAEPPPEGWYDAVDERAVRDVIAAAV